MYGAGHKHKQQTLQLHTLHVVIGFSAVTHIIPLAIAAIVTGQPAAPPGIQDQWTEEAVLRIIDEATSQSPDAFSYTRTLEKSRAIAFTPEMHASANADYRNIFTNDPLSGLPTNSSGEEFVVSDGNRIGCTSHQKIAVDYITADGISIASAWEESGPFYQLYTPIGWYLWKPNHPMLGVQEDEGLPFFSAFHIFSRTWDGPPATGKFSTGFFERFKFDSAAFEDGVLSATFRDVDPEGVSAEPGYEAISTVRIGLPSEGRPRLLSSKAIASFLLDGQRVTGYYDEYIVREWMRVGDLNFPKLATHDLYMYATWFKEVHGQDFWAPLGQMYRNTMRHTDYQQLDSQEARAMLPELPTGDGVSAHIDSYDLAYVLGEAAIWIDGEPYILPEPLMKHPVDGFDHLLEAAFYIPPPNGAHTGDLSAPPTASPSAAAGWPQGIAVVLSVIVLLGIAGRILIRRLRVAS